MTKSPPRRHSIRCRTETDMLHIDDIKHTKFRPRSKAARSHSNDFTGNPKVRRLNSSPADRAARAYNHVGDDYSRYADGDAGIDQSTLSAYRFAQADTIVWKALQAGTRRTPSIGDNERSSARRRLRSRTLVKTDRGLFASDRTLCERRRFRYIQYTARNRAPRRQEVSGQFIKRRQAGA